MRTTRLSIYLLFAALLPLFAAAAYFVFYLSPNLKKLHLEEANVELRERMGLFMPVLVQNFPPKDALKFQRFVETLGKGNRTRITIMNLEGTVLADSDANPASLDNHRSRPEVLAALTQGAGTSMRYSQSVEKVMVYHARLFGSEGRKSGVARLSMPLKNVQASSQRFKRDAILLFAFGLFGSLLSGLWLHRQIATPIGQVTDTARAFKAKDYERRYLTPQQPDMAKLSLAVHGLGVLLRKHSHRAARERGRVDAILEGMGEGVVAVNRENQVLVMNASACRMLDVQAGEAHKISVEEAIRLPALFEVISKVRESGRPVLQEAMTYIEGDERFLTLNGSVFGRSDSSGVVVVLHDVTEIRRVEKIRQDFVANASHELRTPLTVMKGNLETLKEHEDMDAETRSKFIGRTVSQVEHLVELTQDLLSLSSAEQEDAVKSKTTVDLRDLLAGIASDFQGMIRERELRLDTEFEEGDFLFDSDPQALREVVSNLLHNAMKYTNAPGKIVLRLRHIDHGFAIEVQDSGIGIPKPDLGRIFERFYRVDKSRGGPQEGTGLGLAISKHLVERLGGSISVESRLGEGSLFVILFTNV